MYALGTKLIRGENNKEIFDYLLAKLDCTYVSQREEQYADGSVSVFYTMKNNDLWEYAEDQYGTAMYIRQLR